MAKRFTVIPSYDELAGWEQMFMDPVNGIDLLIVGRPGLGKTRAFMAALGTPGINFTYIKGNQTACEMFCKLYAGRGLPILIDDVDDVCNDPAKKNLLKEALENESCKVINWGSRSKGLVDEKGEPIPKSFTTTSQICVITNKVTNRNEAHLSALMSRAFCLEFCPSNDEIHRYAATWFKDEEIYPFVGAHLHLITDLDVRDYGQALKLKLHARDWRKMLLDRWMDDPIDVVTLLLMNDPILTPALKVQQFCSITGQSRRTFMYRQAALRQAGHLSVSTLLA